VKEETGNQVSVHLAKQLQRRRLFRNQPIRNKNCLWRPCLLSDRDEMSNLYRGHAIDASYKVSVHLAKQFQRRRLKKIGPQAILVSDWLISKKSSPLNPLGQMNQNLVGSILGRSSIQTANLVPIRKDCVIMIITRG
jgi:hypothetical protein